MWLGFRSNGVISRIISACPGTVGIDFVLLEKQLMNLTLDRSAVAGGMVAGSKIVRCHANVGHI